MSRSRQETPASDSRLSNRSVAAEGLTGRFGFNIPQRWSIAHLYQAMLNGEEHVKDIAFLTTLAGYVHWRLTGRAGRRAPPPEAVRWDPTAAPPPG